MIKSILMHQSSYPELTMKSMRNWMLRSSRRMTFSLYLLAEVIITVIFTGLSLANIQFYFIQIFQGLALLVIVAFYEIRKKRSEAR